MRRLAQTHGGRLLTKIDARAIETAALVLVAAIAFAAGLALLGGYDDELGLVVYDSGQIAYALPVETAGALVLFVAGVCLALAALAVVRRDSA